MCVFLLLMAEKKPYRKGYRIELLFTLHSVGVRKSLMSQARGRCVQKLKA